MSSSIAAVTGNGDTSQIATTSQGMASLTSEDFLKIMLAELTNQDPLEPMTNQDLLNQVASIRRLETDSGITQALEDLRTSQQLGSAGALIGRQVGGLTAAAEPVSGTVDRVRLVEGEVVLRLADGAEVPYDRVTDISAAMTTAGG
jgi:flagellar basal-body rod modification protein FlgD